MQWGHVLAAVDDSPAGAHALEVASDLCQAANLRLSVVTVLPAGTMESLPAALAGRASMIVTRGVPGIEIVRVAEEIGADLLMLGRTVHEGESGRRLGPTADQVARRSRVPCLFIPADQNRFTHHLVALDGTERGFAVFEAAREFVRLAGGEVEVVTVEPKDTPVGKSGGELPRARTLRVAGTLDRLARENGQRGYPFQVLQGEPTRLLQGQLKHLSTDLLVIGARRGGPAGPPVGSSGTGRTLLDSVPCAVLTVPL